MKSNFISKLVLLLFLIFPSLMLFPFNVESAYTRYGDSIINPTASEWDSQYVKMPSVIYDKSLFKMLYAGYGSNRRWQIGLAYSIDGINWFKFINPIKSRLNYDNRDVHDPTWLYMRCGTQVQQAEELQTLRFTIHKALMELIGQMKTMLLFMNRRPNGKVN